MSGTPRPGPKSAATPIVGTRCTGPGAPGRHLHPHRDRAHEPEPGRWNGSPEAESVKPAQRNASLVMTVDARDPDLWLGAGGLCAAGASCACAAAPPPAPWRTRRAGSNLGAGGWPAGGAVVAAVDARVAGRPTQLLDGDVRAGRLLAAAVAYDPAARFAARDRHLNHVPATPVEESCRSLLIQPVPGVTGAPNLPHRQPVGLRAFGSRSQAPSQRC